MLLYRLHRVALALQPLSKACIFLTLLGAGMVVLALLDTTETQSSLLRIAILFTLWNLMIFAFVRLFQHIPPPVLPQLGWLEKLWLRCQIGFYYLLAFGVLGIGLSLVSLSLKLLMI